MAKIFVKLFANTASEALHLRIMSSTQAIPNKLRYPIFGLVLTLLLSLQLQVGNVFHEARQHHPNTKKELQIEQSVDVSSAQGVLHEINLNFIAAVIFLLLFSAILSIQKVKVFDGYSFLAARNWGCIVPKGP